MYIYLLTYLLTSTSILKGLLLGIDLTCSNSRILAVTQNPSVHVSVGQKFPELQEVKLAPPAECEDRTLQAKYPHVSPNQEHQNTEGITITNTNRNYHYQYKYQYWYDNI